MVRGRKGEAVPVLITFLVLSKDAMNWTRQFTEERVYLGLTVSGVSPWPSHLKHGTGRQPWRRSNSWGLAYLLIHSRGQRELTGNVPDFWNPKSNSQQLTSPNKTSLPNFSQAIPLRVTKYSNLWAYGDHHSHVTVAYKIVGIRVGTCYVDQTSMKLVKIYLLLSPKCWY